MGKIIEIRNSDQLYDSPLHLCTQRLLAAYPVPDLVIERQRQRIEPTGDVPKPINPPGGYRFHPGYFMVIDICQEQMPKLKRQWLRAVGSLLPGLVALYWPER